MFGGLHTLSKAHAAHAIAEGHSSPATFTGNEQKPNADSSIDVSEILVSQAYITLLRAAACYRA